jgi:hypothetical protein
MAHTDSSSSFSVSEDLKLIPRWSIVLAFVAFIGIQYLFFFAPHQLHSSPMAVHVYFGISWGALVAVYILMIGYISQDAPNCGHCHESVRITDLHCTRCGHALAEDNTPARLRAYRA